jgi:hypothetical protein
MSFRIKTKDSSYVVDRDGFRWMRISFTHPRRDDGEWVTGGFTLNGVGASAIAHLPDGRARLTSAVVAVFDEED